MGFYDIFRKENVCIIWVLCNNLRSSLTLVSDLTLNKSLNHCMLHYADLQSEYVYLNNCQLFSKNQILIFYVLYLLIEDINKINHKQVFDEIISLILLNHHIIYLGFYYSGLWFWILWFKYLFGGRS